MKSQLITLILMNFFPNVNANYMFFAYIILYYCICEKIILISQYILYTSRKNYSHFILKNKLRKKSYLFFQIKINPHCIKKKQLQEEANL